jgi:AsmA protein
LPVIDASDVSIADVTLLFTDKQNGNTWRAGPCDIEASRFQMPAATGAELSNSLLITATVSCKQIQTRKLNVADVKFTLDAKQGLFAFTRITMRAYGGQGSGEVHANFSGGVPTYQVHFVLEMTQSSVGDASLHGDNVILATNDLDRELSRYESTQKFNLVDVGALLVAGPLGIAVTKGYDFAKLLGTSGGTSPISKLISEWKIEHGVAEAEDVAMTTKENRLAMIK